MDWNAWGAIVAHWPVDWIIIGAFAIFAAFDAMRTGSARAVALVFSLPVSLLLLQELPQALIVGPLSVQFSTPIAQLGILAAIVVFLYIITHRVIFSFSDGMGPIQALVTGLATAIVLLVVWLRIPGLEAVWHFGDQVQAVFGVAYRFWWLLGSYIALAVVHS